MIRVYVGLPRSGKTYKVVTDILDVFIGSGFLGGSSGFLSSYASRSGNDVKYRYLYTNIEGFKFDEVNDYFDNNDIDRKAVRLDWKIFYHHLTKLYEMKMRNKSDDDLIEYLKEKNLYKVLFVDDEAYMHFTDSTRDPVLVWFLGYHGHMAFDVWLITQNKKKINSKYFMDCETFIEAQPKSKAVTDNRLRYFYYASDSFTKEQRYQTETLKTRPEVYALYKSGDIHKPKKIIYKYISFMLFALAFTIGVVYYFIHHFQSGAIENAAPATEMASKAFPSKRSHPGRLYTINCDSGQCWNGDFKYQEYSYPLELVYTIMQRGSYELVGSHVVASMNTSGVDYDRYAYKIKSYYVYADEEAIRNDFPLMFIPYEQDKRSLLQNAAENGEPEAIDRVNPIDST